MLWTKFKSAFVSQFKGRTRIWVLAFLISSILLIWWQYHQRQTCDFMFHRLEVAKTGALLWAWLLLIVGLTNRGRIGLGIVTFICFLGLSTQLVHYRIPSNEHSVVWRMRQIPDAVKASNQPLRNLSEIRPRLFLNNPINGYGTETISGYVYRLEALPTSYAGFGHYLIAARPVRYCDSGQRSFLLEDNGKIHVTLEDRAATIQDPVAE